MPKRKEKKTSSATVSTDPPPKNPAVRDEEVTLAALTALQNGVRLQGDGVSTVNITVVLAPTTVVDPPPKSDGTRIDKVELP